MFGAQDFKVVNIRQNGRGGKTSNSTDVENATGERQTERERIFWTYPNTAVVDM